MVIKQEKRNTNHLSVHLFRLEAKQRSLRKIWYLGCVDWQTEGYQHLKAQPLILRHIWIFLFHQMALKILAKVSSSSHSLCFFSLGSEVRGTNTKSYHFPIYFLLPAHPPPLKCCFSDHSRQETLSQKRLSPSQSLSLPFEIQTNAFISLHPGMKS